MCESLVKWAQCRLFQREKPGDLLISCHFKKKDEKFATDQNVSTCSENYKKFCQILSVSHNAQSINDHKNFYFFFKPNGCQRMVVLHFYERV